jgi:hypothetical protein
MCSVELEVTVLTPVAKETAVQWTKWLSTTAQKYELSNSIV